MHSACYIKLLSLPGSRRTQSNKEVKYCSTRCRHLKPGPIDRKIESAFASLLNGELSDLVEKDSEASKTIPEIQDKQRKKKKTKGDPRIVVECSDVQALMFGIEKDPEKVFGRKKNRAARGLQEKPEDWRSVDMVDEPEPKAPSTNGEAELTVSEASTFDGDSAVGGGVALASAEGYGGGKIRPPQTESDVNGSVGGEKGWAERIEETEHMKSKRREGHRKAQEKEMVKRAARRGCAFGFSIQGGQGGDRESPKSNGRESGEVKKKCEAVMKGAAVEASFAKGEWGIRWREEA